MEKVTGVRKTSLSRERRGDDNIRGRSGYRGKSGGETGAGPRAKNKEGEGTVHRKGRGGRGSQGRPRRQKNEKETLKTGTGGVVKKPGQQVTVVFKGDKRGGKQEGERMVKTKGHRTERKGRKVGHWGGRGGGDLPIRKKKKGKKGGG